MGFGRMERYRMFGLIKSRLWSLFSLYDFTGRLCGGYVGVGRSQVEIKYNPPTLVTHIFIIENVTILIHFWFSIFYFSLFLFLVIFAFTDLKLFSSFSRIPTKTVAKFTTISQWFFVLVVGYRNGLGYAYWWMVVWGKIDELFSVVIFWRGFTELI